MLACFKSFSNDTGEGDERKKRASMSEYEQEERMRGSSVGRQREREAGREW